MSTLRYHARPGDAVPRIGEYMKTPNGRTAYHVVGLRPGRTGLTGVKVYNLTVEKLRASAVPDRGRLFTFYWLPRGKKRRA